MAHVDAAEPRSRGIGVQMATHGSLLAAVKELAQMNLQESRNQILYSLSLSIYIYSIIW